MNTDISQEEMKAILTQELRNTKVAIYDRSIMVEARKIAGYSEQETAPLVSDCEKLIKVRDALQNKLDELDAK